MFPRMPSGKQRFRFGALQNPVQLATIPTWSGSSRRGRGSRWPSVLRSWLSFRLPAIRRDRQATPWSAAVSGY